MKILDVQKKYYIMKKAIQQIIENAEFNELDEFFDSLDKYKNYNIMEFKEFINNIGNQNIKTSKQNILDDKVVLDEVLRSYGINEIDFCNIELITLEEIQTRDLLSKKQLLILASRIGITKTVFKTKTDLYDEIKRSILNRDVINNIETLLKPTKSDLTT
jgi:hypothetical protein